MKSRRKKKGIFSKLLSKGVILTLQLIASIVFLGYIYILKMLPLRYYLILEVIVIFLFLGEVIWITAGARKKRRTGKRFKIFISKLTSIVLSVFMITVSVFASRGNDFLNNITNAFTQTRVIAVYVMKDSEIENVDDLKDKSIGVDYNTSNASIKETLNKLYDELGSHLDETNYDNYASLADALYNNDVDCIIADQSFLSNLETNHESFSDETKVIYQYEITENINSVTTKTNVTKKPFIVYLTGIDTYGSVSSISRADVNLLVCVNPIEKQILMVSIPRDTQVNLHMNGQMDKITHSAMYGINETIQTLEDFLDLEVNYYAKTNFSGITNIIDALGGVTVNSDYAFTTLHGNYQIVKGKNEMDGDKALCFVRERYALPNGDFDRGKNQQKLLKAILDKAMSSTIITNYNNILSAIEGTFETDMASDDIRALINMQLDDMASWEMFNVQVTGDPEYTYKTYSQKGQRTYVTIPDEDKLEDIKAVINKIESGQVITDDDVSGLE